MDNVLRCSIIFITLQILCIHFGVASINPITNMNYNKVIRPKNQPDLTYRNEPDESGLPWLKAQNSLTSNDDNFDNYNSDGEELDSIQYSDENTQSMSSDYDNDDEYESLISADKRNVLMQHKRGTENHVDLCPFYEDNYNISSDYRKMHYRLRVPYTERICNHTTTTTGYEKKYNKICYSLGRTFEYGYGTHCFQRYTTREIEAQSISGKNRIIYTEEHFRDGCTCGWATSELGPIDGYHRNNILNLCSALKKNA